MKLSIHGLMLAFAILWGGTVLLCALANLFWPPYAGAFLNGVASIYPGYHHDGTALSVIVATGYALLDGAVGGLLLAVLYNMFASCGSRKDAAQRAA